MLTINNLSHSYPNGVHALRNVNLEITKGMFGLLGPNGAGKSSLMRILATLQQPTSGSIKFGDVDVLRNPMAVRRALGYLPQDFGVYPRGSALEHLEHLAVLKGLVRRAERKSAVESLLVQTNLWDARKRRLASFSGGMRQRFGIAQALLGKPELIIVDEPTAGLDPEERNRFHNLLAEIGEEIIVILSTHIVEDVANLCPQMAILNKGEIAVYGRPSTIRNSLDGKVWSLPVKPEDLDDIRATHRVISQHFAAGRLHVKVVADERPAPQFEPCTPQLEDAYFDVVTGPRAPIEQAA